MVGFIDSLNETYRKHPQQRGFPSILKTDHGDIHFRRPIRSAVLASDAFLIVHLLVHGQPAVLRGTARERLFISQRAQTGCKMAYIPEHPQQPVIDGSEDSCHGDNRRDPTESVKVREKERERERERGCFMSGCGCRYLSVRVGEYHCRERNPARSTSRQSQ